MKKFNLKEYIGDNPLLKEIDTRITTDVDLWIPGASDSYDKKDDADYIQRGLENKGIPSKVTVSIDEFYVDLEDSSHLDNAKEVLQDLGYESYTKNNPIKEDGQWDDKWLPSFDDLKNRAKQIKGFEDMGKYGFAVPYEHGEMEIEPIDRLGGDTKSVKITWISPGNEDSQVSPLSTGYKAVDQAIRSSQDKADWKRMAGI